MQAPNMLLMHGYHDGGHGLQFVRPVKGQVNEFLGVASSPFAGAEVFAWLERLVRTSLPIAALSECK